MMGIAYSLKYRHESVFFRRSVVYNNTVRYTFATNSVPHCIMDFLTFSETIYDALTDSWLLCVDIHDNAEKYTFNIIFLFSSLCNNFKLDLISCSFFGYLWWYNINRCSMELYHTRHGLLDLAGLFLIYHFSCWYLEWYIPCTKRREMLNRWVCWYT